MTQKPSQVSLSWEQGPQTYEGILGEMELPVGAPFGDLLQASFSIHTKGHSGKDQTTVRSRRPGIQALPLLLALGKSFPLWSSASPFANEYLGLDVRSSRGHGTAVCEVVLHKGFGVRTRFVCCCWPCEICDLGQAASLPWPHSVPPLKESHCETLL